MSTPWEVANRCPECQSPGKEERTIPQPAGVRLVQLLCKNKTCIESNFGVPVIWMVQINQDGTIPDAQNHTNSPKEYSADFNAGYESAMRAAEAALRQSLGNGHGNRT